MDDSPTEFKVEVVRLGPVTKHPNADKLEMTMVHGGYPCIMQTGSFKEGDLAVYIPVDALVPVHMPQFAFLKKGDAERHRVKAVRLRGIFSMGLLVPVPSMGSFAAGDEVGHLLDIHKYEPPTKADTSQKPGIKASRGPGWMHVYGVEGYRRHTDILERGDNVVITEKIHGCNARYAHVNGKLYVGSHKTFRGSTRNVLGEWFDRVKLKLMSMFGVKHRADMFANNGDVWWKIAAKYDLKSKLAAYPDHVVYGEIYGPGIQDLTYGASELEFVVFDVYLPKEQRYLEFGELNQFTLLTGLRMPPVLYVGPWDPEACLPLADGVTVLGGGAHIREGFVVKASPERTHPRLGRVSLKVISEAYLLRKEA